MSDVIPYEQIVEQVKNDVDFIAEQAYRKGYALGKYESAPHWIPCSERLPEVGRNVLLSVGGVYTAEGCLRADGDWCQFRWESLLRKDMVGAWMPMPEPYRGGEEE